MLLKSKFKLATAIGIVLSMLSLLLAQRLLLDRICHTLHLPKVRKNSLKNGREQGLVQDHCHHLLQGHSMPMKK
ncbi:hypothetical protein E2562_003340 [Oryza meyeriana var. granulata]|uniref:Uncharacterized protein n=1 Tax=Oryza meyeriana var. granulata TaxID=110450 RepID=A0A6G1EEE0_9ORYZ|nr:hypothetical protein E2562_003340 [Oryza meyeriana var. granulata]